MTKIKQHDTTEIQLHSLLLFMNELGYRVGECRAGINFVCNIREHSHFNTISFSSACRLHNNLLAPMIDEMYDYLVGRAFAAKLVEDVCLQLEGRKVVAHKNWIKFTNGSEQLMYKVMKQSPVVGGLDGQV